MTNVKKAIIEGDLVVGFGTGFSGPSIPANLIDADAEQLRFDGSNIVDVSSENQFYIDETGQKHIADAPNRQALSCSWDDELIQDGANWRVKSPSDFDQELLSQGEALIDVIADRVYTNSASRAARYERKKEQAQAYLDAGYPADVTSYPYIDKESTSRGVTGQQLADLILLRADQFADYGADIEAIRFDLSTDITSAPDEASKQQAIDNARLLAEQKTNELLNLIAST